MENQPHVAFYGILSYTLLNQSWTTQKTLSETLVGPPALPSVGPTVGRYPLTIKDNEMRDWHIAVLGSWCKQNDKAHEMNEIAHPKNHNKLSSTVQSVFVWYERCSQCLLWAD